MDKDTKTERPPVPSKDLDPGTPVREAGMESAWRRRIRYWWLGVDVGFVLLVTATVLVLGAFLTFFCYTMYRRDHIDPDLYWRCMDAYQAMPVDVRVRPQRAHMDCQDRWKWEE